MESWSAEAAFIGLDSEDGRDAIEMSKMRRFRE
jgi:hypothetical protein